MANLTSFGTAVLYHRNTKLSDEGYNGTKGLEVAYVGYDRGSERVLVSHPIETMEAASLSFDVRFHSNFQFVKGGKLHGLGPTRPLTGGLHVNPMRGDGWSTRLQFRPEGALGVYTYYQDQPGNYGRSFIVPDFNFEKERWYNLDLRVWVNSQGQKADGKIEVWIDGERWLLQENVRLRGNDDRASTINRFLFSTFHGGSDPTNAPVDENGDYVTVHATFDNFRVGKLR